MRHGWVERKERRDDSSEGVMKLGRMVTPGTAVARLLDEALVGVIEIDCLVGGRVDEKKSLILRFLAGRVTLFILPSVVRVIWHID